MKDTAAKKTPGIESSIDQLKQLYDLLYTIRRKRHATSANQPDPFLIDEQLYRFETDGIDKLALELARIIENLGLYSEVIESTIKDHKIEFKP